MISFLVPISCADGRDAKTQKTGQPPKLEEIKKTPEMEPREDDMKKGPTVSALNALIKKLKPLHEKLGPTMPGDWLESHPEPGQTFKQYLATDPVVVEPTRRTIVIKPIGSFSPGQKKLLELTSEFMNLYFGLPVRVERVMTVGDSWPEHARRKHPSWGDEQLLTGFILDHILAPYLPEDAATYLGLTAVDLWPGEGWNFVFGQASLRKRVGVWSMYRNGDTDGSESEFRTALLRTLKTSTHETGHMFSMRHCIAYECNLCGSNSQVESDRRPLYLCPECLAKLLYATGADPVERFKSLRDFCNRNGLKEEAVFFEKSIKVSK